jgi:hypothetical protein
MDDNVSYVPVLTTYEGKAVESNKSTQLPEESEQKPWYRSLF